MLWSCVFQSMLICDIKKKSLQKPQVCVHYGCLVRWTEIHNIMAQRIWKQQIKMKQSLYGFQNSPKKIEHFN
jgi:hypothetical protein